MFATRECGTRKWGSFVEVIVPRLTGILLLKKFRILLFCWSLPRWSFCECQFCFFFPSSMADVALWLGPYMSISSKKVICTRTEKVRNCRQIITTPHHTKQPDDPQIPQPDLRFVQKKQQTRHTKGARAQTKTPTKRFARGHSGLTTASHSKTCRKWIKHHDIQGTANAICAIEDTLLASIASVCAEASFLGPIAKCSSGMHERGCFSLDMCHCAMVLAIYWDFRAHLVY